MKPLITAVMPTRGDDLRHKYARVAINCFLNQTYPNKELVILNHGRPMFVETAPPENVREIMVQRPPTLGELRNLAFEYVRGEYFMTFDDDDWHHPLRMSTQYEELRHKKREACILKYYLTLDMLTGVGFVRACASRTCGGCCNTIMAKINYYRYPALERHEDGVFAGYYTQRGQLAIHSSTPGLYVRTCHTENVSGRGHILRGDKSRRGVLPAAEAKLIRHVLDDYEKIGGITVPGST